MSFLNFVKGFLNFLDGAPIAPVAVSPPAPPPPSGPVITPPPAPIVAPPEAAPPRSDNAGAFFGSLRHICGPLTQTQVNTINAILTATEHWPLAWVSYGLATAWHEARFSPCVEIGKGKGHPYALPGKYGQPQYGRGLVQLTWDKNYEWADKALNLNGELLKDFDLALRPDIATRILAVGMETGAFTGRRLSDYLPSRTGTTPQFVAARHIINGSDRADLIASYAMNFQFALIAGGHI
jgi:putative chitinase